MTWPEIVHSVLECLQALAIIVACGTAIAAIGAWRREFVGKRRIELAEETLAAFFAVRDAIAFIRNPFSSSDAGKTRKQQANESPAETELLNRAYIVVERHDERKDVFAHFATLKYRFMAAVGKETESIFTETQKATNKIFIAAHMLGTCYWPRQGREPMSEAERKEHLDEMWKHEEVFWDTNEPNDAIKASLASILAKLEKVTEPAFRKKSTFMGFISKRMFRK
jgi:hypothetical protein